MKYFSYISNNLSFKNKLERDVFNFLKSKERTLIDATELESFKKSISDGIENLNKQHARCTPIKPDFYKPGPYINDEEDNDIHLHVGGFVSFLLYSTKE